MFELGYTFIIFIERKYIFIQQNKIISQYFGPEFSRSKETTRVLPANIIRGEILCLKH